MTPVIPSFVWTHTHNSSRAGKGFKMCFFKRQKAHKRVTLGSADLSDVALQLLFYTILIAPYEGRILAFQFQTLLIVEKNLLNTSSFFQIQHRPLFPEDTLINAPQLKPIQPVSNNAAHSGLLPSKQPSKERRPSTHTSKDLLHLPGSVTTSSRRQRVCSHTQSSSPHSALTSLKLPRPRFMCDNHLISRKAWNVWNVLLSPQTGKYSC